MGSRYFVGELALTGLCKSSVYALVKMPRPGQIIDDYTLTSFVGAGGTCEVFSATDTRSGRVVALKVLREEHLGHAEVVFRFLNESLPASLRTIRHPAIIEVFETSQPDCQHLYHAVELLHGSLAQRLLAGPLYINLSLRLAGQIASALALLHKHEIVHRDVKPSNVLLTSEPDDSLHAKLADFGLARFPDADTGAMPVSTAEGTRLGTSDYMPPEQWDDARGVTGAADLYSLGCSLYQMISGRRPFSGNTDAELRRQHLLAEPDPLPRTIPNPVRVLIADMMAKPAYRRPVAKDVVARINMLIGAYS